MSDQRRCSIVLRSAPRLEFHCLWPTRHSLVFALVVGLAVGANAQQQSGIPPASSPAVIQAALPDAPSAEQGVQSNSLSGELGRGVRTIGKDELTFLKAPFQKKNLKWDIAVGAATAALISTDVSVLHQVNPAWHDTSINISNAALYSTAASAGGIFLDRPRDGQPARQRHGGGRRPGRNRQHDSLLRHEGCLLSRASLQRQRRWQFFSGNFTSGSFPSGHSAFTWTLASVIAHEYPKWPVALVMYGMATTVSTARVTAGSALSLLTLW